MSWPFRPSMVYLFLRRSSWRVGEVVEEVLVGRMKRLESAISVTPPTEAVAEVRGGTVSQPLVRFESATATRYGTGVALEGVFDMAHSEAAACNDREGVRRILR